jgi:hypothetical protein
MSDHRVYWQIDRDSIDGVLLCSAGEGAYCRTGCLEGCEFSCDHEPGDTGSCLAVEWISSSGSLEVYHEANEPHPLVSGPVEVRWDWKDENWVWRYLDEPEVKP